MDKTIKSTAKSTAKASVASARMGASSVVGSEVTNVTSFSSSERDFSASLFFRDNPCPMAVLDENGFLLLLNQSLARMIGYPSAKLVGKPFMAFLPRAVREIARDAMSRCLDTTQKQQFRARLHNTDTSPLMLDWHILTEAGHLYVIGKPRRLDEPTMATLRMAINQLNAANYSRHQFMALLNHEVRTPLNAVMGFSEVIAEADNVPELYKHYARDIYGSAAKLLQMLADMMDLSSVEIMRHRMDMQKISIATKIAAVIQLVMPQADVANIQLQYDATQSDLIIHGDRRALRQILLNLILNAIRYNHARGCVKIETECVESWAVIRIIDNGRGMSKEQIAHSIVPFDRVEDAYTHLDHGAGLGLPISRLLCELHGGTLQIESIVGEGTTVTIRLPGCHI